MDFIKDSGLREKIKNAMNYSAWLYKFINESEQDDLIKEESYRVIILYVHSCIEATLINFYENYVLEKIEYKEYTNIQVLNEIYQNKNNLNSFSVLAIQTKKIKTNHIEIHELVRHFETIKILKRDTVERLNNLSSIRNTHHLGKIRKDICVVANVEAAFELLEYILDSISKVYKINESILR